MTGRNEPTAGPTMIDLFAGCGGMTAGFVQAGFVPRLAVEWDAAAAGTYAANFGEDHLFWGDIAELHEDLIPQVDVVIGGPPCQGFSNLGTRDPNDPRNKLWREYLRVVRHANPQVFVIENVDRFLKSAEFGLLEESVAHGELSEYELTAGVLNAADYGVPQRRRRTIVVGSRIGKQALPTPTHAKEGNGLTKWRTVREAFGGVSWETRTTELPDSMTSFTDIEGRLARLPGSYKEADLHIGRKPRQLSLMRYDAVPPGGGRFDLPVELLPRCWREKPTGTTDVLGRMRWDAPSLTVRTEFFKPEKGAYLHPQWDRDRPELRVNRPITHREAARLQTFPQEFLWCGSKIEIAKQIGNAVPVHLAQVLAAHVQSFSVTGSARDKNGSQTQRCR